VREMKVCPSEPLFGEGSPNHRELVCPERGVMAM
jgi:hypothetical protein